MACLSYAYYRLPYADSYTLIESEREPLVMDGAENIGRDLGFAIVPFKCSEDTPALLIQADAITTRKILPSNDIPSADSCADLHSQADVRYSAAFDAFHNAVARGEFVKLVLARSREIALGEGIDPCDPHSLRALFERTCRLYPRLMIMLFSTPLSGTWIVASPEILVDGKGDKLHTMALAGTMPFHEGHMDWSEKNKNEQNIVERYIENTLSQFSADIIKDGPVTMRAGNLVHLRTDFRFHLSDAGALGRLIMNLHPTPAVCGMPKNEAAAFISANEGMDRRYYSGFAGPVGIEGETHLYVALRCAEISSRNEKCTATLYAGGGIMPGSECQSEWQETESKMNTIRYVLQ